jgi:LmbE family N-acetylglucosaminyl deacetylase
MRKVLMCFFVLPLAIFSVQGQETRLENVENKTILVFTPHPDDDVFGAGGTIALLNRNHNKVHVVVYTNDDKGSYDPEMTSQRLARIRRPSRRLRRDCWGRRKKTFSGWDTTTGCWNMLLSRN